MVVICCFTQLYFKISDFLILGTSFIKGSVAEWSKALVLGTSLSGRGFESHRCQIFCHLSDLKAWTSRAKHWLEMRGIEPLASRMRIERSTTELHPQGMEVVVHLMKGTNMRARLAEWSKA